MFIVCPKYTGEEPFLVASFTAAVRFSDSDEYTVVDVEHMTICERGYERPLDYSEPLHH